jgi:hypothetical protein
MRSSGGPVVVIGTPHLGDVAQSAEAGRLNRLQ